MREISTRLQTIERKAEVKEKKEEEKPEGDSAEDWDSDSAEDWDDDTVKIGDWCESQCFKEAPKLASSPATDEQ